MDDWRVISVTVAFYVGVLAVQGVVIWQLWQEVQRWQRETSTAQDRLLAAWREGAVVPTRNDTAAAAGGPLVDDEFGPGLGDGPLTTDTEQWLRQWEEGAVRAKWEGWLRGRLRAGRTPEQALADAELELVSNREPAEDEEPVW